MLFLSTWRCLRQNFKKRGRTCRYRRKKRRKEGGKKGRVMPDVVFQATVVSTGPPRANRICDFWLARPAAQRDWTGVAFQKRERAHLPLTAHHCYAPVVLAMLSLLLYIHTDIKNVENIADCFSTCCVYCGGSFKRNIAKLLQKWTHCAPSSRRNRLKK